MALVYDDKTARTALLEAVEGTLDGNMTSPRAFLRLFVSNNQSNCLFGTSTAMTQQRKCLLDLIATKLSKAHARRFFGGLHTIVEEVIKTNAFVPASVYQNEEDNAEHNAIVTADAYSSENLSFLHYAAVCVKTYCSSYATNLLDECFFVALALHDTLFLLNSCGPDALTPQTTILSLCEYLWLTHAKEEVTVNAIPLILLSSDFKRMYAFRHALNVIDLKESSNVFDSLLRLASSPACLKCPQGKKLLAFLLQSNPELRVNLHHAVRVQIPSWKNNKTMLDAYGEVYFLAWKTADEPGSRPVEETILSDLAYSIIHVENAALVKSLHVVMDPFYQAQKTSDGEGLLYRLYSPILWRSLTSSNATIQVNAAKVLAQVFPLQTSTHDQTDLAIKKACAALTCLLQDVLPIVRVAAAEAVGRILSTFWDVIPSTTIQTFLDRMYLLPMGLLIHEV
jgi:condensin-2 complex subunit G2